MTSSMAPGGLDDAGLLPLEQGVLTENCGASFVVVITKSDLCKFYFCIMYHFQVEFDIFQSNWMLRIIRHY